MTIELKNISKSYGEKEVIKDFFLSLPEKGTVCFFGKSGCGKTTLASIFGGIIEPDSGVIIGTEKKKISVVFQEDRLLPWLNCRDNINLAAGRKDAFAELKYYDAEDIAKRYTRELSGGMKRRAALARATAYGGDVCILDEPFKGLDGELAEKSVKRIGEVFDKGLIILITHLPEEAAKMADKVIFFKGIPLEITGEIDFDVPPKNRTESDIRKYSERISEIFRSGTV